MRRGLISFDMDGTLEFGDPPGVVTAALVRRAQELGFIVGSCSDRTVAEQRELWHAAGVVVDFTIAKLGLPALREQYNTGTWLHLGDTVVDRRLAASAGFEYIDSLALQPGEEWLLQYSGRVLT